MTAMFFMAIIGGLGIWAAFEKANLCRMPHFIRSVSLWGEMLAHVHTHHKVAKSLSDDEVEVIEGIPLGLYIGFEQHVEG